MREGQQHYTGSDLESDSFGADSDDDSSKHYTEEDLESDSFGPDEEECDECGALIPDSEPSMVNASHEPSCSLYPPEPTLTEKAMAMEQADLRSYFGAFTGTRKD
jgi:hypothetical protein